MFGAAIFAYVLVVKWLWSILSRGKAGECRIEAFTGGAERVEVRVNRAVDLQGELSFSALIRLVGCFERGRTLPFYTLQHTHLRQLVAGLVKVWNGRPLYGEPRKWIYSNPL